MASTIDTLNRDISTCVLCDTCVHASNKKVTCVLCARTVHLNCIGSDQNIFYCCICLGDTLPFVNPQIDDDEFHGMFGIMFYTARRTLNDYPMLNLNPYADLDSKLINNEFVDVDSNHYNFICSRACSYYDSSQLNNLLPTQTSSNLQSMVHFNARSISANLDTLFSNLMMLKHKFSIIAVTETWTDSNSEQAINIPGYNKIIKSRDANVASRGGGVALFFSSDLAVDIKRRPDMSCPNDVMECIFVQISHKQISTKDRHRWCGVQKAGDKYFSFQRAFWSYAC